MKRINNYANVRDFAPKEVQHIRWQTQLPREEVSRLISAAIISVQPNHRPQPQIESQIVDWLCDNKGTSLLLYGLTGRGKTFYAQTIIPYMLKVLYNKNTHIYTAMGVQNDNVVLRDALTWAICSVDDVGIEACSSFKDMAVLQILDRVDRQGKIAIFTTNLSGESIKERYGDRAYSRIVGNFTRILFDGDTDFRTIRN